MTVDVTLEGLQDTRALPKTTYVNGKHTLTFYTSGWNTTRKVTVSGFEVETDTAKITYTDGEASSTVNTLYIAAGNVEWESIGDNNDKIYLLRNIGDERIGEIGYGKSKSNTTSKLTIESLKPDEKLYLRYRGADSYSRRYSTTAMSAESVVVVSGTTYTWTKDTTKPSY